LVFNSTQSSCLTNCPVSTYARNNTCINCPSNCLACSLSTSGVLGCTICNGSYAMLGTNCVLNCPEGYYLSTQNSIVGNVCLLCPSSCTQCVSTTNCTQCKNSLYTTPNCTSPANCTTGYLASNGTCQSCNSQCLTCYGSQSYECLSCPSGQVLTNGQCILNCPSGSVKNGSACVNCPIYCTNCSITNNSVICSACSTPYLLASSVNKCIT